MLNFNDVVGMCECTEEEIEAIAIHEHIPEVVAAELANYLILGPDGVPRIHRIIIEDIEIAISHGQVGQAQKLKDVLRHFVAAHYKNYQEAA